MNGCHVAKPPKIPPRIFYVWDGPLPEKISDCINSWKRLMPDYDVVEVNNSSPYFDFQGELERCAWFKVVYERKMWAFVADYIRVKTLRDHGGIYCDTDITALKPFDCFLGHEFFAAFESWDLVNLSIFGCVAGHPLLCDLFDFYQQEIWETPIYTIPEITTYLLTQKYQCVLYDSRVFREAVTFGPITLYPETFFYPYRYDETYDERCISEDTHTIHWWGGSWLKPDILRWLSTKHLTSLLPVSVDATTAEFLQATPKELRLEVRLFGQPVLKGFKQGCYRVYEILGLSVVAVWHLPESATYFLFSRIKLFTRKKNS